MTGFVSEQMKLVMEELRGAKEEVESYRLKYDGMFSVQSPHKGCYIPFARGLYTPSNLIMNSPHKECYVPFARGLYTPSNLIIIMFTSMQYTNQATCVVFINDM